MMDSETKRTHTGSAQPAGRLAAILHDIRNNLPLPHEIDESVQTEEGERLAVIINTTDMGQPLIRLAHRLSSRDLRYIFPFLAFLDPKDFSRHFLDKLYLVIRERACYSLYQYGWTLFQKHFPCPPVARGLSILCGILEIREKSDTRPLSGLKTKQASPLISHLAAPDSRFFVAHVLRSLERLKLPISDFLIRYKINPDWPFCKHLLEQCYLQGSEQLFKNSAVLFQKTLTRADTQTQASLLKRLFQISTLDGRTLNRYYQAVYRVLGHPSEEQPVWAHMKKREVNTFSHWITAASIGSHCKNNRIKARFYLRYANVIRKLKRWNDTTLLLYFPGFLILDDNQDPFFAMYKEQPDPDEDFIAWLDDEKSVHPASPERPHRRVEDAVARASTKGTVGLLFDRDGLPVSTAFIDFCLVEKKVLSRHALKNLPPVL